MRYNNNTSLIGLSSVPAGGVVGGYHHQHQQFDHAGARWGAPALPTVGRPFVYPSPEQSFLGLDMLGMSVAGQQQHNSNHISYGGSSMAAFM